MTTEFLNAKEALRKLIDDYAELGDQKKIAEQMELFTENLTYQVYMNGMQVANVSGREQMEREFNSHAAEVKTYFTLNGQHNIKLQGNTATGISYTQIKMIREAEGKNILTDYSVKYEDYYVFQQEKWLIKDRSAHFIIVESRAI